MNPSWRIDELARRVLQAARWPGAISCVVTSEAAASGNNSPTPHLDELERSLEIRLPPLVSPVDDYVTVSGIRTCTVPNDSEVSAVSSSNNTNNNSEVWTWAPHANSTDNSYSKQKAVKSALASSGNEIVLEELAPFPPDFYRAMGELVREAFHPESVKDLELTQSIHKDAKKYNRVYFRARLYKYDNLQVSFVAGAILSAENAKCSTNHEDFAITPRVACRFIRS